jgi:hypothetical protein
MPRIGDLQNCKIYKLVSMNNPEMVYYGHTCQTLAQRFAQHNSNHNKTTSKQIIDKGDAIILLVEHFPCLNENEARAREGFYILNNPCVNRCVAGRTDKQYYIDKKEILVEYQKKYDSEHKEQIRNRMKLYRQKKKLALLNNNNNNGVQEII